MNVSPRDWFLALCEDPDTSDEKLLDALLLVVDERIAERLKAPNEEIAALAKALWGKST